MRWNSLSRIALVLALGSTPTVGISAQSDSGSGPGDTYVTLDGYGLGRIVEGSLTDVTVRARTSMVKLKIVQESSRTPSKGWRELRGKKGNLDVSIRLKFKSTSTTRVEVNARQGLTGWDKGFEQEVLDAIAKH